MRSSQHSPPLDASARVTVTKRRTVSALRSSASLPPLPARARPVSFILHRISLPLCQRGPGGGSTILYGYPCVALVPHDGGGRWEFTSMPSGAAIRRVEGNKIGNAAASLARGRAKGGDGKGEEGRSQNAPSKFQPPAATDAVSLSLSFYLSFSLSLSSLRRRSVLRICVNLYPTFFYVEIFGTLVLSLSPSDRAVFIWTLFLRLTRFRFQL